MIVRQLERKDYPRILEIYNPYITDTLFSLELDALTEAEFFDRIDKIVENFPFIVYEENGRVEGFAYLSPFHTRLAYRFTVDISIYTDMASRGRGIGSALITELEKIARASGFTGIIAIVTDENTVSLAFHEKHGFVRVGHFENIAYKFGKRLGAYYLIKQLDDGQSAPEYKGSYGIRHSSDS